MAPRRDDLDEVGAGPLSRGAAAVLWVLTICALVLLTGGLPLTLVPFLTGDAANVWLVALLVVPMGPALAAAMFTWRRFIEERDLRPASHFLRGYRLNAFDVLRWWVPTVAALAVIAFSLAHIDTAGLPAGYGIVLIVIAVAVLMWAVLALALSSHLSLRTRDVARLSAYYLAAKPLVAVGVLSLLVLCVGIVLFTSDWVLVMLSGLLAFAVVTTTEPVVRDATARFTA
ncbi:glycosyl transferase [Cellulomonas wangsupingiae]|uniref:Glycosyl transferase n=1 Tax=Cellulomonas wangsupingiae TaxID=2968085 RepID=A0ABY5K2K9_9CELL|nr:glycosyl transferase [Cellulomonas wangsupingiae]MCC2336205.1 glycosyl transferase [Cellulomonas wangsupingiae]UUI64550.1 glycosyl transferase [Cellulomonas wangsupingiae]